MKLHERYVWVYMLTGNKTHIALKNQKGFCLNHRTLCGKHQITTHVPNGPNTGNPICSLCESMARKRNILL